MTDDPYHIFNQIKASTKVVTLRQVLFNCVTQKMCYSMAVEVNFDIFSPAELAAIHKESFKSKLNEHS